MLQVLLLSLLFHCQATSDVGPRLLRQEAPQRLRLLHGGRHAVAVGGSGVIAPLSGGFVEATSKTNNDSSAEGEVSDVTLTARLGHGVPRCQKLLQKARHLLHFHASQLIDQGRHKKRQTMLEVIFDALNALDAGNATEESLEVIQAAIGNLTLKTALQDGKVWTATDQGSFFYHCFPGLTPFEQLEEHNFFGDIELDPYQEPTARIQNLDPNDEQHEVRYCYRIGTNATAKRAFVAARKHIQEQVPCLRFVAIKPDLHGKGCVLRPAIEVRDQNSGCWAGYHKDERGRNTGIIYLNLGRGCEMKGMIVHQLTKILGVRKELTRIDRDRYLNVRTDRLRETWMERFFARRHVPPAVEAYAQDPFDYLSINMFPATAFTNGSGLSLEPAKDAFLAKFLGQRMSLSQLDVEALGDLYGCPATIQPASPTRVLSQLLLAGRGIRFDGSCRDQLDVGANLTLLLGGNYKNCASVEDSQCTSHKGVPELCPFSCLRCIPADDGLVSLRNQHFQKEAPLYCDDAGCHTTDSQGHVCKTENPAAEQIPCGNTVQALYCDDAGCESLDPDGRECRERNPGANQIQCAVVSHGIELHGEALKATKDCADLAVTGIKFKSGPKATCRDLQGYCGHGTLGPKVRQACPATCSENGYPCNIPEEEEEATNAQNLTETEGCRDKGKDERPLLKVHGLVQTCEEISHYCLEHVNSSLVQKKCPFTCGACVPGTGYRSADADEDAKTTLDILESANLTKDILARLADGSIRITGDILADATTTAPVEEG